MKAVSIFALPLAALLPVALLGCGTASPRPGSPSLAPAISSVIPSANGTPNAVALFGNFEFVSIQQSGQIFTYDISSGAQVAVGQPFQTPCADPSGMAATTIAGTDLMAVVCYDTGSLLTLRIAPDGSLSLLGSVSGLPLPYPGVALDGTNVYVPLFGSSSANGAVARVDISQPGRPVVAARTTLASPGPGEYVNPGFLAVANGFVFVCAGSESDPQASSSTVQVLNETSMALVGAPLSVAHSPQQIAIAGSVALVTLYDAAAVEAIDLSNPASLKPLDTLSLSANPGCHPIPIAVVGNIAYAGCYDEGLIAVLDVTDPARMLRTFSIEGVNRPQLLRVSGSMLLVPSSVNGGSVYEIVLGQ